jgi:hypothetical protein
VWQLPDSQIKELFQTAKDDGFTIVNAQIRWSDIQPDIRFPATASTYIQGGSAQDTNFADAKSHKIGYQQGVEENQALTYLKFDFSGYSRSEIDAAKVRMYVNANAVGNNAFTGKLYGITDNDWDAATMTWNNGAPNHDGHDVTGTLGKDYFVASSSPSWDPIRQKAYYDFDVSDFVDNHAPDKVASFILQATASSAGGQVGATIDGAKGAIPPQLVLSDKNSFDWTYLDKVIGWAEDAGIKFEPVWFGADTVSVTMDNRVPYYVMLNTKVEKLNADGSHSPAFSKNADPAYGVYWYLLDKNDLTTRAQEKAALKAMMNHIAAYDKKTGNKHTVVGVDTSNEPGVRLFHGAAIKVWHNPKTWGALSRFPSEQDFVDRTMWEYQINLANAVKESRYPVWTRMNNIRSSDAPNVLYNERMRDNGGTSLDFVGLDPYSPDADQLFDYGHQSPYNQGDNLPMVMENAGSWPNAAHLALATLAGGAFYNTYDMAGSDNNGLYIPKDQAAGDYTLVPRGSYVRQVATTNNMLTKIAEDIASKQPVGAGGTELNYLNIAGNKHANEVSTVRALGVSYKTANAGVGITDEHSDREVVVLSSQDATFTLSGITPYGVASVQTGHYDGPRWVKTKNVRYTTGNKTISFNISAGDAIRVVTKKRLPRSGSNVPYTSSSKTTVEEAESLSPAGTPAPSVQTDSAASNGKWIYTAATKAGDTLSLTLPRPSDEAHRYDLTPVFRSGSSRGIVQASVNGTKVGGLLDLYNPWSPSYIKAPSISVDFGSKNTAQLTFTVTGKNALSSAYQIGFDRFELHAATDKTVLYQLTYDYANARRSDYVRGWQAFTSALAAAKSVLADADAAQAPIDCTYTQLKHAIAALVPKHRTP